MITAAEAMSIFVPPKLRSRCRDPRLVCDSVTYSLSMTVPVDFVIEHLKTAPRFSGHYRYEIIFEETQDTYSGRAWKIPLSDGKPKAVFARKFPEDWGFKIVRDHFEFFNILNHFWR